MRKNFDDYVKAVKSWYLENRETLHSGVLAKPSGAGLRDLSRALLRDGLSAADEQVFRLFFEAGAGDDLDRAIGKCDPDKFRSVIKFMLGESKTTNLKNVNLIAVLTGFPHRPLARFRDAEVMLGNKTPGAKEFIQTAVDSRNRTWRYALIVLGIIIATVSIIAFYKPSEGCMAWRGDHYETIGCDDSSVNPGEIDRFEAGQFKMRKVKLGRNEKYFIDGKPQYWYLRRGSEYEFYNSPGYHPIERQRELQPISTHIALQVFRGEIISN